MRLFPVSDFIFNTQPLKGKRTSIVKAYWKKHAIDVALKFSVVDKDLVESYTNNFSKVSYWKHNNVIQHYDIFTLKDEFEPFSLVEVLEFANLGTLKSRIKIIKEKRTLNLILRDILTGYHQLHLHGVLHRDIKAENILLHRSRRGGVVAKISDIEFSQPRVNDILACMTTPEFLAPEVTDYNSYTSRSEIWAFGTMLYEILTEQCPFGSRLEGLTVEAIRMRTRTIEPELLTEICTPYRQIIEACLQKDPDKRPASFRGLKKLLGPWSIFISEVSEIWKS